MWTLSFSDACGRGGAAHHVGQRHSALEWLGRQRLSCELLGEAATAAASTLRARTRGHRGHVEQKSRRLEAIASRGGGHYYYYSKHTSRNRKVVSRSTARPPSFQRDGLPARPPGLTHIVWFTCCVCSIQSLRLILDHIGGSDIEATMVQVVSESLLLSRRDLSNPMCFVRNSSNSSFAP